MILTVALSWLVCMVLVEWPRVTYTGSLPASNLPQDDIGAIRSAGVFAQLAAVAYASAGWLPVASDARAPFVTLTGIVLMFSGAALRLHCFALLRESFTLDVRARAGQRIVQSGAYSYLRHPAYLGGLLTLTGFGLALNTWAGVAQLLFTALAIYVRRIGFEERALLARLGRPYARFCASRWRLVPWVY
jgi:protein-S-isoprenylcysteine O-methyltransferase Ste14